MKFIDLFAGIGGFALGLERNGFKCVWANEWDKYAGAVYKKMFPETPFSGEDIRAVDVERLPEFDLLCGGFPCQAFSIAGKRKGFDDTRGTLFFEIARIIKARKPKIVLLENVKGLLSHEQGRTFGRIIEVLGELGYWVEWQVFNSKDFGVPQNRERVFIVGHLREKSTKAIFPFRQSNKRNLQEPRERQLFQYNSQASTLKARDYKGGGNLIEVTNSMPDAQRVYSSEGIAKTLKGCGGGQGAKTGLYSVGYRHPFPNAKPSVGVSPAIKSSQGSGNQLILNSIRRLTPGECERLQGFPDNWTEGFSDTQRYKMLGNAVTVNVVQAIAEKIKELV